MYPYKSYMLDLLNFGRMSKLSHMQSSLFYKDSAGFMNSTSDDNHGAKKRRQIIQDSNGKIEIISKINCDLFNTNKYLINGVDLYLKFNKHDSKFYMMNSSKKISVEAKIKEAILYVRKVKVAQNILLAHSLALEKATAKYPIKRVVVSPYVIPSNVINFTTPNLALTVLPTRLVLGLVSSEAYNGTLETNPFNFEHFFLRELNLTLDSKNIPYYKSLDFDFDQKRYLKGYWTLFDGIDGPVWMNGNDIDREEYPQGYTLFAFDLTGHLSSGYHFELLKTGNLVLDLKFDKNLEKAVTLLILMEFDNVIEINKSRKVIKEYQI